MSYFLILLTFFTFASNPTIDQKLKDLVLRLKIQTVMTQAQVKVNSSATDQLFYELTQSEFDQATPGSGLSRFTKRLKRPAWRKSKSIEIYFEGEPLPTMSELKLVMLHDKKLKSHLMPIARYKKWTKEERILMMLAQAQKLFGDVDPPFLPPEDENDLENRVFKMARSKDFPQTLKLLEHSPELFPLWDFVIVPEWIEMGIAQDRKKIRCLRKNEVNDVRFLRQTLERCKAI